MVYAPSVLCLKCRRSGHNAKHCKEEWESWPGEWFYGSQRRNFRNKSRTQNTSSNDRLCKRCRHLDIIQFLEQEIPWESSAELDEAAKEECPYFKSLGTVGSTIFQEDCSLCRCLFALTPNPSSFEDKIWLVPDWTMKRLEGGISSDTREKRNSTKSLLVFLSPVSSNGVNVDAHQGDALCLIRDDENRTQENLHGRILDQKHVDFNLVNRWLSQCSKLHPITCKPVWSEGLKAIRLVDVRTRQIVPHPRQQCDYLALSYVWGLKPQKIHRNGQILTKLPKTIEDAMTFVHKLGKRYLWVDSLCIDQDDEAEKLRQIGKMSIIYRGAYATIIALSGSSAESGLPRIRSSENVIPQMSCTIKGRTLVSLMPNLSRQVWQCPWGQRAWTLQEALLSRRCIYISNHQMYFECNAMQCCESIDETKSWVHETYRDEEFLRHGHLEPVIGAGVLRSPFIGSSPENDRFQQYGVLTNLYSYRYMTNESDALNAFSGIVQYLTEVEYKNGFFWGLPLEDLNWALVWSQRYPSDRRLGFPSWSWTGWHGWKFAASPDDIRNPQKLTSFLRIWKQGDNSAFQELFQSQYTSSVEDRVTSFDDPLLTQISTTATTISDPNTLFAQSTYPPLPLSATFLFIQGLTFTFTPDLRLSYGTWRTETWYAHPVSLSSSSSAMETNEDEKQEYIELRILSNDAQLDDLQSGKSKRFLLLARERLDDGTHLLYTMFLKRSGSGAGLSDATGKAKATLQDNRKDKVVEVMERGTVVTIAIHESRLDLLRALNPAVEEFVLA